MARDQELIKKKRLNGEIDGYENESKGFERIKNGAKESLNEKAHKEVGFNDKKKQERGNQRPTKHTKQRGTVVKRSMRRGRHRRTGAQKYRHIYIERTVAISTANRFFLAHTLAIMRVIAKKWRKKRE